MSSASPLGRGLGSLIPGRASARSQPADASPREHPQQVALASLTVNPRQPRSSINHEGLEELVRSIREHGILQPLVVKPKGGQYEIIAGERRFQAAKIVGLKAVPVIVRNATEQEQLELALVENLQRQDLNPLEEAEAYQQLTDEFNLTQEQIAKRVGKSRSYIANTVRLRGLPAEAKKAILDGAITEGHAKVLLSLPTPAEQLAFLKTIIAERLTVRASEALIHDRRGRRRPTSNDPQKRSDEETLGQALGTKVRIQQKGHHGSIVIEYYSDEERRSLIERLSNLP